MSGALKEIWEKVDQMIGPQRMETEAEHIARDMREGRFPERSDPIQVPVAGTEATAIARMGAGDGLVERLQFFASGDGTVAATCAKAAAHIAALTAERDEALESVTNNNEWFGMHSTLWMWLITQPDMPQLDDLEDGGADEVAQNYERAITALVDARTDALRAKVARLEVAGDFARLIGNDAGKDDKDTVLVSCGMLRRLRAALTDGGKDG